MKIANYLLGVLQLILIGYILYKEINKKSPAMFLWATLGVMFGFPHLITVIAEDLPYKEETIMKASLFVVLFCLIYILARSKRDLDFLTLSDSKRKRIENDDIAGTFFESFCFFVFVASIVGSMFFTIRAQGGLMNTSWGGSREIERSYFSISGLTSRLYHMLSGLSLYFFLTKRRKKAAIVLLLQGMLIFVTRNRVMVLPLFIFVITLYLLKMKRIRLKHIITGIVMAIAVIYIVYAIRAFRWLGSLSDAFKNVSFEYINSMVLRFINDKDGELGLRQFFYYFIEHNNQFDGFNKGYTYIRMLLVYIPSQLSFGLKPESFDLYMGKAIGMDVGGSMHPTLFGDCFGNLGWFGIFLGGLWAGFANLFDKLINRQRNAFYKIMIFFMISYSYVVIGRGSIYNGFEATAWGLLFIYLFKVFLGSLKKIRFAIRIN